MIGFLKRYSIILAAASLLGAVGVARWGFSQPELTPPPAVEQRPPVAPQEPVPPPPSVPKPQPKTAPTVGSAAAADRGLKMVPTPRLTRILADYEGPLFRGELLASVSRHIQEEGDALRAEGLLEPTKLLLAQLEANQPLPDCINAVLRNYQDPGRRALLRQLDFQMERTASKIDPAETRPQEQYHKLGEFRSELERSIVTP